MPKIVTYTPLAPPQETPISGEGKMVHHSCVDSTGKRHHQRLPLGSVRGILYLDAVCLHCGAHLIWIEDGDSARTEPRRSASGA
ncbi:MAG: hypothetical protein KatS3mg076_1055 [Candidatus Binatia bacterium]|nr:MAG: hypothetical protein KatS3mg076_1055 [Candidatus Binatia bacterium]